MIPVLFALVLAQAPAKVPALPKEIPMTAPATGTFDVKVKPQQGDDADWGGFGRLSLDKRLHGDLEGTSRGQMLTEGDGKGDFGGYVALERVTGTLRGRQGSFVLMHAGTLVHRKPELTVTVVPGSGTGALKDLAGRFRILMAEGKHSYEFEYTLPAP